MKAIIKFIRQLLCKHTPYPYVALNGDWDDDDLVCSKCGLNYKKRQ